jgi:DNA-binding NtrC family response regulator
VAADSTVTSPQPAGQAPGVLRLRVLRAPAGAHTTESKVLERAFELSRDAHSAGGPERWQLDDPEVSGCHARLEPLAAGTGWRLRDADSHNGSFVAGLRVAEAELHPGAVIRVGGHLLLVQALDLLDAQRLARRRPAGTPLIGDSPACRALDAQLAQYAPQAAPVLIVGESGTGKELVARQLHTDSGRKGPLITVNCATLSEGVADSELFGHRQGAFSGASQANQGLFAAARGGTLFLDELGELPLPVQAKLLRVIETGEVRAVGSSEASVVDTRVVAATHVDLEQAVREGRFRGDLQARLQGLTIRIAPLRERRDDVLPLARHFLAAQGARQELSVDAAEALLVHDWPFNVRELRQVLLSAVAQAGAGKQLELAHLPAALQQRFAPRLGPAALALPATPPADAAALRAVLEAHAWNVAQVAQHYAKDRKQIYRWCEALGIALRGERD